MQTLKEALKQFITLKIPQKIFSVLAIMFIVDSLITSFNFSTFEYAFVSGTLILANLSAIFNLNTLFKQYEDSETDNQSMQIHASSPYKKVDQDFESVIEEDPQLSSPFIFNFQKEKPITYVLPELPSQRSQIIVPSDLHNIIDSFLEHAMDKEMLVKPLEANDLNFIKSHQKQLNQTPLKIIETRDSDIESIFNNN